MNNGVILVYDTTTFNLIRIFGGIATQYIYLEFSRDNYSQLVALTTEGVAKSFLMKGRIPELPNERAIDSYGYFDAAQI
jgi:hypothetical protein